MIPYISSFMFLEIAKHNTYSQKKKKSRLIKCMKVTKFLSSHDFGYVKVKHGILVYEKL